MAYKEDGSGTLWVPNTNEELVDKEEQRQKAGRLVESLKKSVYNEDEVEDQWLGGYQKGDFKIEEMYVDSYSSEPALEINGKIEDIFLSLNIPIKNNKEMQKIAKQINKVVTIDPESSGLYLKPKAFSEVRTKTADGQGRINLGKNYAGEDVRVVVLNE